MRRVNDEEAAVAAPRVLAMMIQAKRLGNGDLVAELQEQLQCDHGLLIEFLGPIPEWKGGADYADED